ncbi:ATP-binding cassette domain-containing protein [Salinispora sp. H7-4]|uniref:ATP-binding cassette domain-containing protein n=1 Tax=Salinispora sp. H7-4 TaxID=2748321 RepID=UPI0015D0E347|nr:ATP-binding cassette domain-containing protein [Salinispora sp. H7-4]NYT95298.1 ATP-binding cassette domain-containing protein [Salinispora sp. H7-4]
MIDAIEVHALGKRFGDVTSLAGVDLRVAPGTVFGLLGPNGAGKTTLVRILTTQLTPDTGSARVGGHDVVDAPQRVRRLVGLSGQFTALDERLTGVENLLLFGRLFHLGRRAARQRATELVDRLGLGEVAGRPVGTYSGGLRRRFDIAAGLIGAPAVLFLDEPTTGLDVRARQEVWAVVRELVAAGTTVLLTTHYLEEADQLADAIAVLDRGRVVAAGSPAELRSQADEHQLEIRVTEPQRLPQAVAVVRRHIDDVRDDGQSLVRAPLRGGDGALVSRLLGELHAAEVPVEQLLVRQPSLDDLVLSLTGDRVAAVGSPRTAQ